jgi:hypothetical protein
MKHKLTRICVACACLLLMAPLAACGAKASAQNMKQPMTEVGTMSAEALHDGAPDTGGGVAWQKIAADTAEADEKQAAQTEPQPASTVGRKLIKDLEANIETKKFDAYLQAIMEKTVALGGHVSSKNTFGSGYSSDVSRNATLVLRVPAAQLDRFQATLEVNGKVTNLNESVRDVTAEYTDVAAHIKVLKTERETLTVMLEKTNSIEELLQVRQQLTQTRYELDALEGQMRVMEDQIALSTVTLHIEEVARLSPVKQLGFFAGAWELFCNNFVDVVHGLRDFLQGFLGAIPYLVLLAVPVALVIIFIARRRKRRKASR